MKTLIDRHDSRVRMFFHHANSIIEKCEHLGKEYYPMLNGRRFLTVRQVSERLHISRRTIFDMIDKGTVPHYKIGGKLLIAEQDLENLLNASYRPSY